MDRRLETQTMKTCYVCKGPVERVRIEYMARRAGQYTLIRDLPVERCAQCGEVYLDDAASREIDNVLSRAACADASIEVPVVYCR